MVRVLGAVQAQDYGGAKWALSRRTAGATDAEIELELDRGTIVRTHVLRPTWHFVVASDLRCMLDLTAPRVVQATAYYNRQLELTPAVFRRSNAALGRALRGGKALTRLELRAALERAGVQTVTTQRLGHLMLQAELDALVCSGPRRGRQFTYALVDERIPASEPLQRDEALVELVRRYFATLGPATVHDFAWWSGLTITDVRRTIDIAGTMLERQDRGEKTYWLLRDRPALPRTKRTVHLLPNYDEYFIGYRDRSDIGQRIGNTKAVTGGNALIANVIAVDGQLVGGWRRTMERRGALVEADLVVPLKREERAALVAEVRRYGEFLGVPVELRLRR